MEMNTTRDSPVNGLLRTLGDNLTNHNLYVSKIIKDLLNEINAEKLLHGITDDEIRDFYEVKSGFREDFFHHIRSLETYAAEYTAIEIKEKCERIKNMYWQVFDFIFYCRNAEIYEKQKQCTLAI